MLLNYSSLNSDVINGSTIVGPQNLSATITESLGLTETIAFGAAVTSLLDSFNYSTSSGIRSSLNYPNTDDLVITSLITPVARYSLLSSDTISILDTANRFIRTSISASDTFNIGSSVTLKAVYSLLNTITLTQSQSTNIISTLLNSISFSDSTITKSNLKVSRSELFTLIDSSNYNIRLYYTVSDNTLLIDLASKIIGATASSDFNTSTPTNIKVLFSLLSNVATITTTLPKKNLRNSTTEFINYSETLTFNSATQINSIIDFYTSAIAKEYINLFSNISIDSIFKDNIYIFRNVSSVISLISLLKLSSSAELADLIILSSSIINLVKAFAKNVDSITLTQSSSIRYNSLVTVINTLNLLTNTSPYLVSSITDSINLNINMSVLRLAIDNLIESIYLSHSELANSISLIAVNDKVFNVDTLDLKSILSGLLSEDLVFVIPSVTSPVKYNTYAFSPETSTSSTYNNYNFDGCSTFGDKYLFYNSTGIYEYGGVFDDGIPITSEITTSSMMFGTDMLKSVPNMYLGTTSSGSVILKVRVDGRGEYIYKLNKHTNNLQTQKISLGKGLIGRYFQFELISSSEVLNLSSIEFTKVILNRKL